MKKEYVVPTYEIKEILKDAILASGTTGDNDVDYSVIS